VAGGEALSQGKASSSCREVQQFCGFHHWSISLGFEPFYQKRSRWTAWNEKSPMEQIKKSP